MSYANRHRWCSPRRRGGRLAAVLGCGLGGLGTAGLVTSVAGAAGATVSPRPGPGRIAAIGIGPAYHTMAPPLVRFGPGALCPQRARMAILVRRRPDERVTVLSLTVGHRRARLGRRRRAPLTIVLRHLPRGSFSLRLRLRVVIARRARGVAVVRRYRPCTRVPRGHRPTTPPDRDARSGDWPVPDRVRSRAGTPPPHCTQEVSRCDVSAF